MEDFTKEFERYAVMGDNGDGTTTCIFFGFGDEEVRMIAPFDFVQMMVGGVPGMDIESADFKAAEKQIVRIPNSVD